MMKRQNQQGFGHVLLLVLIVAVAVVGFAAYRVYSNQQADTQTKTEASTKQSDLTSASKDLDQAGNDLNNSLDDSALNADLDSM